MKGAGSNVSRPGLDDEFVAEDLRDMGSAPRYNEWLFSQVRPYLGRTVVEVGSGIGNMTGRLLSTSERVICVEPNQHCVAHLARTHAGHPGFQVLSASIEDVDAEALRNGGVDTVVCVNVLEHIADDVAVLRKFGDCVTGLRASIVLLVPAVPLAFGPIDTAVGHFRRYSRGSLRKVIESAGLVVETMYYMNLLGLAGWIVNSKLKRVVRQSPRQIRIFDALTPYLESIERLVRPPVGLSLFSVARRKP